MDAREAVLARVRGALATTQEQTAPPVPRKYRTRSQVAAGSDQAVALLVDRLRDYQANVAVCAGGNLVQLLGELLRGRASVVVPPGLPAEWVRAAAVIGAEIGTDTTGAPLSNEDLDAAGAVLTGARVAIAETGTIVLDAEPDQGRRAITLVPDHHVCVLGREQIVATVPEAITILGHHPERPLTWIAGPSATSDIELIRVEGVHGPRTLDVIITT
ncbi:lactate utilization protein C [Georgenia sp. AZ-5]|uniref:LutC/YkgG family protein n=1 Tax=Georgenia sp. AZ-5 TaxID=3367526 RepID=UPI003754F789